MRATEITPTREAGRRVLIAGVGNILRGDDGFGPAVIDALESAGGLPEGVRAIDVGIGGMNLIHELMNQYDALVLVDAVDRDGDPGSLYLLEPEVPDLASIPVTERSAFASDMHEAVPDRTLIIARAAGALPPLVRIVGCQPAETEEFSMELSPVVQQAVPAALDVVRSLLSSWLGNPEAPAPATNVTPATNASGSHSGSFEQQSESGNTRGMPR